MVIPPRILAACLASVAIGMVVTTQATLLSGMTRILGHPLITACLSFSVGNGRPAAQMMLLLLASHCLCTAVLRKFMPWTSMVVTFGSNFAPGSHYHACTARIALSYVSTVTASLIIIVTGQHFWARRHGTLEAIDWTGIRWWEFLGGPLGATELTSRAFIAQRIGLTSQAVCNITGQVKLLHSPPIFTNEETRKHAAVRHVQV
jgi:uncharacterized membrane protein YdcZ (DUF606 family)